MQRKSSNSRGFGLVEAILLLVVVAVIGAGVLIYTRNNTKKQDTPTNSRSTNNANSDNTGTNKPDQYSGWKTATLTSPQLSFRYPADWTITATPDGRNIEVKSPTSDGHLFSVSLISGKSQDVNLNFLGNAPGTKLLDLTVDGKSLYLAAQTAGSNGAVTGLGLATTPGGAMTSFGIIDPQKVNNVTMVGSLIPVTPSSSDNGAEYSMTTYTSQASYQNVLKIFQSLTGSLPN